MSRRSGPPSLFDSPEQVSLHESDKVFRFRVIYGEANSPHTVEFEAEFAKKEDLNTFLASNPPFGRLYMKLRGELVEEEEKSEVVPPITETPPPNVISSDEPYLDVGD